jgi:hypothetical protein
MLRDVGGHLFSHGAAWWYPGQTQKFVVSRSFRRFFGGILDICRNKNYPHLKNARLRIQDPETGRVIVYDLKYLRLRDTPIQSN